MARIMGQGGWGSFRPSAEPSGLVIVTGGDKIAIDGDGVPRNRRSG